MKQENFLFFKGLLVDHLEDACFYIRRKVTVLLEHDVDYTAHLLLVWPVLILYIEDERNSS